jgi:hypothetical protein
MGKTSRLVLALLAAGVVLGSPSTYAENPKKDSNLKTDQQYFEKINRLYSHQFQFDSTAYDEKEMRERFSNISPDTLNKYFPAGTNQYSKLAFTVDCLWEKPEEYVEKFRKLSEKGQGAVLKNLYTTYNFNQWETGEKVLPADSLRYEIQKEVKEKQDKRNK